MEEEVIFTPFKENVPFTGIAAVVVHVCAFKNAVEKKQIIIANRMRLKFNFLIFILFGLD